MEIIIHIIYLSLLPLAVELGTEVYRARVLGRRDKHFLTATIRLAIMLLGALSYSLVPWYKTLFAMFSIHYLIFNYAFNKYGLVNARWSYLGNNFLDNLQKKVNPVLLLVIKIVLVGLSIWWV